MYYASAFPNLGASAEHATSSCLLTLVSAHSDQNISIAVSGLDVELQIKGFFDPDYIITLTSQ